LPTTLDEDNPNTAAEKQQFTIQYVCFETIHNSIKA